MNIPPNNDHPKAMSYERFRAKQDRLEWRREMRRRRKDLQIKARKDAARAHRRSLANCPGNLAATLSRQPFVPSAPTLRKKTPTEG
jgi:hypothetical protein